MRGPPRPGPAGTGEGAGCAHNHCATANRSLRRMPRTRGPRTRGSVHSAGILRPAAAFVHPQRAASRSATASCSRSPSGANIPPVAERTRPNPCTPPMLRSRHPKSQCIGHRPPCIGRSAGTDATDDSQDRTELHTCLGLLSRLQGTGTPASFRSRGRSRPHTCRRPASSVPGRHTRSVFGSPPW